VLKSAKWREKCSLLKAAMKRRPFFSSPLRLEANSSNTLLLIYRTDDEREREREERAREKYLPVNLRIEFHVGRGVASVGGSDLVRALICGRQFGDPQRLYDGIDGS